MSVIETLLIVGVVVTLFPSIRKTAVRGFITGLKEEIKDKR